MLYTAVSSLDLHSGERRKMVSGQLSCLSPVDVSLLPVEHDTASASSTGTPAGRSSAGVLGHIECIARAGSARWTFLLCLGVLAAWLTLGRDSLILMQSHLYSVSPVMSLQLRFKWSIF